MNPQGSMMSSGTPRHAASRIIAPVFCGISGWYKAKRTRVLSEAAKIKGHSFSETTQLQKRDTMSPEVRLSLTVLEGYIPDTTAAGAYRPLVEVLGSRFSARSEADTAENYC
jgi:hypothetical protein